MFNFGGSVSGSSSSSSSYEQSESGSVSGGFASSSSQDSVAFEDVFARLFGGAEGAAAGLDPSMLTQTANQLFSGGMGFMDQIGADPGTAYMADRLGGDNAQLQEQIDLLGEDLGSFFNEELNPAITGQAAMGGQLGGGRQGVAQGRAMQEVGSQFARGASALRSNDLASRDAMAGGMAQTALQGVSAGLQGLPMMAGMADMGFSAGMAPYERLAAILGDKSVLNQAASSSADFARAFSSSFGQSRSSSSSSSVALSLGPGG